MPTAATEAAQRKNKLVRPPKKECAICKAKKPLTDFYSNADWKDESGVDRWCKSCVTRLQSKEAFKEYCWENRREWNEDMWNGMVRSAEKKLVGNDIYEKSTESRRKTILERTAIQNAGLFLATYYKFIKLKAGEKHLPYAEAIANGLVDADEEDPSVKTYSDFFNGYFDKRELEYLTKYYDKLEEDFVLDNENLRDYAKKCARASL